MVWWSLYTNPVLELPFLSPILSNISSTEYDWNGVQFKRIKCFLGDIIFTDIIFEGEIKLVLLIYKIKTRIRLNFIWIPKIDFFENFELLF